MLIINADDFGRSRLATDRTLFCYKQGGVTSASAMVFMDDSQRAADLAREYKVDVGLHVNFTQELTQRTQSSLFYDYHGRIVRFLNKSKYSFLIYNPALRKQFEYVFQVQLEEFQRLYSTLPSHIDGHHHMHLCANMLIKTIIPAGQKVRRNFSFVRGDKSLPNRAYRAVVDKWLARRYLTTDYLFSFSERIMTGRLAHALELARSSTVELQTHPENIRDFECLIERECDQVFSNLSKGTYAQLVAPRSLGNNS